MSLRCVLIVEPDIIIRHGLAEYLRECGYRVLEALDAAEARQLLANKFAPIDVVLADVDAPGENGFALAAWMRRACPDVAIILAGSLTTAAARAGDLCEEGPTLGKPYDHRIVHDHIKRLLATRDRGMNAD
ncbi:MAG TPA: response regulator [Acetobacteraceae bacterium]|nr:response regulator [Acetobacteraceae bacterium]